MSFTTLLALCLSLILCVSCYPAEPAAQQHAPPSTPPVPFPTVYSPVVLAQLCEEPTSYCIYVDQIRPGAVRASPVNATDDRKSKPSHRQLSILTCTDNHSLHCLISLLQRAPSSSNEHHTCPTHSTSATADAALISTLPPNQAASRCATSTERATRQVICWLGLLITSSRFWDPESICRRS